MSRDVTTILTYFPLQIHGINGIPINIAGQRPASVDIDTNISDQSPNPGIQAVTRRGPNQGIFHLLPIQEHSSTDPTPPTQR